MKLVIQRVKQASITVDKEVVGQIGSGMLVFVGIEQLDTDNEIKYFTEKITQLRIFDDSQGKMNLSALDVKAEFLVVSQFTLLGNCSKGRRPSFDKAGDPKTANEMYERFVKNLKSLDVKVETGRFGAMMDVALVNDGPVTFILDSQDKR